MPPIKINPAYMPVEIELWGGVYETLDLTSAQQEKEAEIYSKAIQEPDEAKALAIWGRYLDLIIRPVNGARKPSTAVKAVAKADEITSRGMVGVVMQIRAAEQGELARTLQRLSTGVRPT